MCSRICCCPPSSWTAAPGSWPFPQQGTSFPAFDSMRSEERRVGKECRSLCDWSSDVCSSDLYVLTNLLLPALVMDGGARVVALSSTGHKLSGIRFDEIGRASCRERV